MSRCTNPASSTWVPLIASAACICATAYLAQSLLPNKVQHGPEITANMLQGFCSHNQLLISRLPAYGATGTSYSTLLHLFHELHTPVHVCNGLLIREKTSWGMVPNNVQLLSIEEGKQGTSIPGVLINRTTLITILIMTNARVIHEFSSASGYRAALGSWCGQWYIEWQLGQQRARVSLRPHDSHSPATDVYPAVFPARVDACVKMMAGVVQHPHEGASKFAVAFPSRMPAGEYCLEYQEKGFPLSHGARHIYNMNGGKVYEVDFLLPRRQEQGVSSLSRPVQEGEMILEVPSSDGGVHPVRMYVALNEQAILAQCLDYLPWAYLSWSIHRGMRDILLAFSRKTMQKYRQRLARQLYDAVPRYRMALVKEGWEHSFVDKYMGPMASSAILAERGNSGDAVRIVTALAALEHAGENEPDLSTLDKTDFWRQNVSEKPAALEDGKEEEEMEVERLSQDTLVALVKVFVLEWSVDFDYQFYHRLPIDLLLI